MTTFTIIVASYGDAKWNDLARERAWPSAEQQDAKAIFVYHADGTQASCRNAGAEAADTDYLVFLDADDELSPNYIRWMRGAAQKDPGALLTPMVCYVRGGIRARARFWPECDLRNGNWLIIGTAVPRDLFHAVGGFRDDPHGLEDWSLWARCVRHGARISRVHRAVYIAHVNKNSKHHQLREDKDAYVAAYEKVRREVWPELYERVP